MADLQPRVQAPAKVAKGEIFEIRTLISHPMETGLRFDEAGHLLPRALMTPLIFIRSQTPLRKP